MIRRAIKAITSVTSGITGEVIGECLDDEIRYYCMEMSEASDSIIGKGIFGAVGLVASAGIMGRGIRILSDKIGDMVSDNSGC